MENIEVVVRLRPPNEQERENNDIDIWNVQHQDIIAIAPDKVQQLTKLGKIQQGQKYHYQFTKCYDKIATNYDLYLKSVKRITQSSLQGINGTIFMYGQTGSGKTFSMLGLNKSMTKINEGSYLTSKQTKSLNQFNANKTIQEMQYQQGVCSATSRVSRKALHSSIGDQKLAILSSRNLFFNNSNNNNSSNNLQTPSNSRDHTPARLENIHNFKLDNSEEKHKRQAHSVSHKTNNFLNLNLLINSNSNPLNYYMEQKNLLFENEYDKQNNDGILVLSLQDLFNEIEKKEFIIKGAVEEIITSIDEILILLRKGEVNRHYASTFMNHISSRSHTIFRLYIRSIPINYNPYRDGLSESILV